MELNLDSRLGSRNFENSIPDPGSRNFETELEIRQALLIWSLGVKSQLTDRAEEHIDNKTLIDGAETLQMSLGHQLKTAVIFSIESTAQTSVKAPYIDSLRDIITELTAEHQDQLIQEAEKLQEGQDEEDI